MNINISDNVLNKSWKEIVKEISTNPAWQEMKKVNRYIIFSNTNDFKIYSRETLYQLARGLCDLVTNFISYMKNELDPGICLKNDLLISWKNYCILYEVLNNLEK